MAATKVNSFQRQGPKLFDRIAVGTNRPVSAASAFITGLLTGSISNNFASVAVGAQICIDAPVVGAAIGDLCLASSSIDPQGLNVFCAIRAVDNANICVANTTAGAVDLGLATFKALVVKASLTT